MVTRGKALVGWTDAPAGPSFFDCLGPMTFMLPHGICLPGRSTNRFGIAVRWIEDRVRTQPGSPWSADQPSFACVSRDGEPMVAAHYSLVRDRAHQASLAPMPARHRLPGSYRPLATRGRFSAWLRRRGAGPRDPRSRRMLSDPTGSNVDTRASCLCLRRASRHATTARRSCGPGLSAFPSAPRNTVASVVACFSPSACS